MMMPPSTPNSRPPPGIAGVDKTETTEEALGTDTNARHSVV